MVSLFRYPKRRLKKLIREGEYVQAIELGNRMPLNKVNQITKRTQNFRFIKLKRCL